MHRILPSLGRPFDSPHPNQHPILPCCLGRIQKMLKEVQHWDHINRRIQDPWRQSVGVLKCGSHILWISLPLICALYASTPWIQEDLDYFDCHNMPEVILPRPGHKRPTRSQLMLLEGLSLDACLRSQMPRWEKHKPCGDVICRYSQLSWSFSQSRHQTYESPNESIPWPSESFQ